MDKPQKPPLDDIPAPPKPPEAPVMEAPPVAEAGADLPPEAAEAAQDAGAAEAPSAAEAPADEAPVGLSRFPAGNHYRVVIRGNLPVSMWMNSEYNVAEPCFLSPETGELEFERDLVAGGEDDALIAFVMEQKSLFLVPAKVVREFSPFWVLDSDRKAALSFTDGEWGARYLRVCAAHPQVKEQSERLQAVVHRLAQLSG